MPPITFQGIDPSTTGRTGVQAKQYLEGAFGNPLSTAQVGQAHQFLSGIGYADPTGQAAMSGQQWNQLLQEAARQSGGTFNAWQNPDPTAGPLQVPDAPTFEAPTLQLPTGPAPTLNLPTGPAPTLNLPEAYTGPGAFTAPTADEMTVDPGYQFRSAEQQRSLEHAAAAKGMARTGGHLTDLLRYSGDLASQEYGNVYNRSADTLERNRRTGLDVYDRGVDAAGAQYGAELGTYDRSREDALAEYGAGLDVYDRGREDALAGYESEFRGAESEYAPRYDTWTARNRAGELNLDDTWRRDVYNRDDAFRRERATEEDERYERESDWRSRVYGDTRRDRMSDEEWRQLQLDEDRRRFLTGVGL